MGSDQLRVIWDPAFGSYDFGPGRWAGGGPRSLAFHLMQEAGLFEGARRARWIRSVRPASRADLRRFHTERYLELVERASEGAERIFLDSGDTPSFPGCFEAAARIAGGAIEALEGVRRGRTVRAYHPSGGLHHARRERAGGFCIVNDIGVALERAIGNGGPYRRVAYVDIDAHHGDGVMYGFYDSGRVLDIDFHQDGRTLFPGTGSTREVGRGDGAGLKVNLPLPPGTGDAAFSSSFLRIVPTMLRSYRPELVVLQHGVDGHVGDRLAQLRYTSASFELAVRTLSDLAAELCGGRILVTGGGGYNARTVPRVLAKCGFLLLGGRAPTGRLPIPWMSEFRTVIGRTAPTHWSDRPRRPPTTEPTTPVERAIRGIERSLGVRFPTPP